VPKSSLTQAVSEERQEQRRIKMKSFIGCGTALVTPFKANLSLDKKSFCRIVDWQIKEGIDFLVPCGTTGESPTLTFKEHKRVIEIVIDQVAGKVPVIAGTGSNNTKEALELTRHAKKAGADGCLVVSPYYNKPTQNGLISHFNTIADIGLPLIVYNIPGRTGVNITPETMAKLSEHENIVGIKEATGNLEQMTMDILLCGKKFTYLSGDDTLTLPLMSVGGHGVISVVSNILPSQVKKMVNNALKGDWNSAQEIHLKLFPLSQVMFIETNPIPVKFAMAMMGLLNPIWRSPMTPPSCESQERIRKMMETFNLLP